MGSRSDTGPYSMALVCCLVLAVFSYFFPLTAETRTWQAVVFWLFGLAANAAYFKKEELKNDGQRTFNETLAYLSTFVVEVVFIAFLPLKVLAGRLEAGLDLTLLLDSYLYLMLFLFYLQYSLLGTIAAEKGMRGGLVTIVGLVCAAACMGLFYVEVSSPGVQLPAFVQPIGFLPALFLLLRLRTMESYGHI